MTKSDMEKEIYKLKQELEDKLEEIESLQNDVDYHIEGSNALYTELEQLKSQLENKLIINNVDFFYHKLRDEFSNGDEIINWIDNDYLTYHNGGTEYERV